MANTETNNQSRENAGEKARQSFESDRGSKERQKGSEAENAGEKRKILNQAEIDKIGRENEEIKKRNEAKDLQIAERRNKVDAALELIYSRLSAKGLSEKDRARLEWVKKSVEGARAKLKDGRYAVEVRQDNKLIASREEPVMVDGLIRVVSKQIDAYDKRAVEIKQIYDLKNKQERDTHRLAIGSLDQETKKREWLASFKDLPNGKLKNTISQKVREWQATEGREYSPEELEQQLGEAAFQAVSEYTAEQMEKMRKNGKTMTELAHELEKTAEILENSGLDYFKYHYGKNSSELSSAEQKTQHLYTEREANLIAIDSEYRQMLLEDYEKQLPANFENLSLKDQNYNLAMLALEHRLLFTLPKKEKLVEEPGPVFEDGEKRVLQDEIKKSKPVETNQSSKLVNTKDPYDIENDALSIPEKPGLSPSEKPGKIFLIDMSEIAKRMAWTKAEERLRKEFAQAGLFKRAMKGLSENYKRLKYFRDAKEEIEKDNNLMRAISERVSGQPLPGEKPKVSAEYLELLDKVVGEYKVEAADAQREVGDSLKDDPEVKLKFAELLHRFRTNQWEGDAYKGLDKRASVELFVKENIAKHIQEQTPAKFTQDADRLKEARGLLYASNFYEICETISKNNNEEINSTIKAVMEKNPEANIEEIKEAISKHVSGVRGLELQLGLKERDLINNRPKGVLEAYEKWADWAENKPILGKIVNPFVIGAAVPLGVQAGRWAIKGAAVGGAVALGASGFWVPLGIGAALGGAYRAIKRSKDIKYDQAQELRHQTLGGGPSEVLGKNGEMGYGEAVMSYKEALEQIKALQGKTSFTDEEKQKLAKIAARLQMERDLLADTSKKFTKVDLFKLEEAEGKAVGSTAGAKADLRVALKKLNLPENLLQTLINQEKGKLLEIINKADKSQNSFRRKEMAKAGVYGAIMGIAGGTLGQQAGYELGRLLGSDYLTSHGTVLEKTFGLKHGLFGTAGHETISAPSVVHSVRAGHSRSAVEWLHDLKGKISGGNVETIHTRDWYDNPTGEAGPHIHNANELKYYISKDSSGDFHYKVPVKQGDSWLLQGKEFQQADINKAFSDGRIKMIFVPDGSHPSEGIVLDVDASKHEIIIPKGSELSRILDPSTGRPKGTGFFGLAEQMGQRPDGSKNYIWINSDRNNGAEINFGNTEEVTTKIIPGQSVRQEISDYDQTIPTVPLTRKYFDRPEETLVKAEKKRKKEEEKKAKDKVKAEEKQKKLEEKNKKQSHKVSGHETGGGGGGGAVSTEKTTNQTEIKVPEFKGDVLKRYLNSRFAAELLRVYEESDVDLPKINKKAIKFALQTEKKTGAINVNKPVKKDIAKAVWELEQSLVKAKVLSQDQADEFFEELSQTEPAGETKPVKEERQEKKEKDQVPAGTFKADIEKAVSEKNGQSEFAKLSDSLKEKTSNHLHINLEGELMEDSEKVKVLEVLDKTLEDLPKNARNGVLMKFNKHHKDTDLRKGLIVGFPGNASKLHFDAKDRLIIPPNTDSQTLKDFLLEYYKGAQERINARKEAIKK